MPQARFFKHASGITVGEIAALTGADLLDEAMREHRVTDVASLETAGPDDLTFLETGRFKDALSSTRAGACLMAERFVNKAPAGTIVLRTSRPYNAFVAVQRHLFPDSIRPASLFEIVGIAPTACVHSSAQLDDGVTVDPGAMIGPRARIGAGALIGANTVIGPDVTIGRGCAIGNNCSITHAIILDRVIIHPGCLIGQDGFGYVNGAQGLEKVPQLGRVVIHDDVEIGAGTTIDRGGLRDTVIGQGTKIDNQVQIGHNVVLGRHCIVVAQSGLSGSVTFEDRVVAGARVGIVPHITVGAGAQLTARSSVTRNVPAGERWGGHPNAKPVKQYYREVAMVDRMARRAEAAEKGDADPTS